jgi:hypothetical protein
MTDTPAAPTTPLEAFDAEIAALDGTRGTLRPKWAVERLRNAMARSTPAEALDTMRQASLRSPESDR